MNEMNDTTTSTLADPQEFARFTRKFRSAEGRRMKITDETRNLIRRQKQNLERLRKENETLKQRITFESRIPVSQQSAGVHISDAMRRSQAELAKMMQRESKLAEHLERMETDIRILRNKVTSKRTEVGGVNAAREAEVMLQRQARNLENRLDKALVKFNEAIAKNKELRDHIDNLRCERVVFDGIYKKLERELLEKKRGMADVIERSNTSYEARDIAQAEILALTEEMRHSRQAYEQELVELDRIIEADQRMREFYAIRQRGARGSGPEGEQGQDTRGSGAGKAMYGVMKEKTIERISEEKVKSFEESLAEIQDAVGISDIDELVTTFITTEDDNFSNFRYFQELSAEIESLAAEIESIRTETQQYRQQDLQIDSQNKTIAHELEESLAQLKENSQHYQDLSDSATHTLKGSFAAVKDLFEKARCDPPALTGSTEITELNILEYLGLIEQRVNEILSLHAHYRSAGATGDSPPQHPQPPQSPAHNAALQIVLPTTADDEEDAEDETDDDEERPLTREELKMRTLRGLSAKGQRGRKKGNRARRPTQPAGVHT
eukprot:gnl/Trimastix_PCT/3676.p1 GENE.gnl/Trimastix_PCT/3676~~gnl/Trimastix_PCT/3676.p1  ORF type:complete len:562 (-),score=217.93 gnl/Trimastix_PCT/3676:269-1927(-)